MPDSTRFRGLGTALITPFKNDGSLDEKTFEKLIDHQIEEGTDFLVPCGTTGENPALSAEEHLRVVELTVKRANGRVPVVAGAGNNSTPRAVELAIAAIDLGADALLTITPYYNKPTPDGLLRHFGAQAEAVDKTGGRFSDDPLQRAGPHGSQHERGYDVACRARASERHRSERSIREHGADPRHHPAAGERFSRIERR
jgi:hypothetical protein